MNAWTLDRYQAGASRVHSLDPRAKIVITVLYILSNVLLPDGAWLAFLLSWLVVLAASALSSLGIGYVAKRSFVALPFALAAVSAIVAIPGRPLLDVAFGPWQLVATDAGLVRFLSIVIRSWLSVQMAILLTATTPFPDLIHALRHLYVPSIIIAIVSFMYRYLAVLTDEVGRLLRARDARSARLGRGGGGTVRWRARVAGNMAGQLFLRSYERSDRVYNAMLARGYQGQLLTANPHTMHVRDWAYTAAMIMLLVLLQAIGRILT